MNEHFGYVFRPTTNHLERNLDIFLNKLGQKSLSNNWHNRMATLYEENGLLVTIGIEETLKHFYNVEPSLLNPTL